ncbi:MAG TPA: hypothetical protein PKA77_12475, partial [Chitinophagaceae bacterium]|nr:hypothetical protein [Chitinophagaceae bacterium]
MGFFFIGKGIVWDSAACYPGQRKALCPALNLFLSLLFFRLRRTGLDKKSNKKVKEKRMLRLF